MIKVACCIFVIVLFAACSEKPGGIIVMNEETIENFFEKDKQSWNPPEHLNLLIDQPVTNAEIPPVPAGLYRIAGTLVSDGPYAFSGGNVEIKDRGSAFKKSVYGMLGPAGNGGNAWFYADFRPETGEIITARAYLYGFMGGVCDMRKSLAGSYGQIDAENFTLKINGPCLFPQISGSTMDYALLIQARGENPAREAGAQFDINYIIYDSGAILNIPQDPRLSPQIYDAGRGHAWIN